ncbi:MAG: hypothetical protein ABIP38_11880 [Steroidobacteraceae bacterium]
MKFRANILVTAAAALLTPLAVLAADTSPKDVAKLAKPPAVCDQVTGSRIKPRAATSCDKQAKGPFRSYSAERLQDTGEIDMAAALRKLDPSFQ